MTRYGLRDDQWARIEDLLAGKAGDVGGIAQDNRRIVEAALLLTPGQAHDLVRAGTLLAPMAADLLIARQGHPQRTKPPNFLAAATIRLN
jgi:hypothetical protein